MAEFVVKMRMRRHAEEQSHDASVACDWPRLPWQNSYHVIIQSEERARPGLWLCDCHIRNKTVGSWTTSH
jgi:hypothetical protein